MESIGYILLYFLRGELSWQGVKAQTKHEKYQIIMEKKMSTTAEMLCNGLPNEFQNFMQQVMDLQFEEQPNYDHYRALFRNLFKKMLKYQLNPPPHPNINVSGAGQGSINASYAANIAAMGQSMKQDSNGQPILDWISAKKVTAATP